MEIVTLGVNRQNTETKEEKNLIRINKESDFPLAIKLSKSGQVVPFPECDFTMEAHIEGSSDIYRAKRKGGVCKHCKQDGDRLIIFFDNHNFVEGRLLIELTIEYPDPDYSEDGIRQEHFKEMTPIQIVADNGDALDLRLPEPRIVEREIPLPPEIKELAEAAPKAMEYSPFAGVEGLLTDNNNLVNALAAQELLKYPKEILHDGSDFVNEVNKFIEESSLGTLVDERPFIEQTSRIALLKAYAQSYGISMPISSNIFYGVYLNQLNLTLRGPIDIQGLFSTAHIGQLRIYLTEGFEIAKNMTVSVNSYSSHEEWVNYRNSDDSEEMTSWGDGYIKYLHLKFDADKQEQAITLIRNLGYGAARNIYLEATEPIDGQTFNRWLVEALKPYDSGRRVTDNAGHPYKPNLYFIGGNLGTKGIRFDGYLDAYEEKGYVI